MIKLKVFDVINSQERNSSVDIFRFFAIVSVVIYHYDAMLPYGYLGVDLFFVISGLLVGGIVFKEFKSGNKVNFFKFILQRGFKIWPSYYSFIFIGNILAYILYHSTSNSDHIIPFDNPWRYLLFYQNYRSYPYYEFNLSFDHVWSLCVEEHFYIMLPLVFIIVQFIFPAKKGLKSLIFFLFVFCLLGIVSKFHSAFISKIDDFTMTHNRIDALAIGVMCAIVVSLKGEKLKSVLISSRLTFAGLAILIGALVVSVIFLSNDHLSEKFTLHTFLPLAFAFLILGTYHADFSRWKIPRFVAYYSYNWYLWHLVFFPFIGEKLGSSMLGLLVYLIVTFAAAFLATVFIEEPFMQKRKRVIDYLFKGA
jgi:peptidoglycan/LPS O-acetylase OafA/YrhL